jgi:glucose-1-phosphate cytidylyltransferase
MKVVILAGGLGTRLAEETEVKPKPMVDIGGHPIIWHIMKHFGVSGFSEFVVALGYKGEIVKRFFLDHVTLNGSMTISLEDGSIERSSAERENWTVHLVDTGLDTMTGGRLARVKNWLGGERFMLTYGDGVSNVDLSALLDFHLDHGRLATITAVRPPARWGALSFEPGQPVEFTEKPQIGEGWINGGFMVIEPEVLDVISSDETTLEADVLEELASRGQVMAFPHEDFWQAADTLRDLRYLRSLWESGKAPWKTWS